MTSKELNEGETQMRLVGGWGGGRGEEGKRGGVKGRQSTIKYKKGQETL